MLHAMPGRKMINTPFADYDYKDGEPEMIIHVNKNAQSFDINEVKIILRKLPFIKNIIIEGIETQSLINDCFRKIGSLTMKAKVYVSDLKDISENSWLDIEYLKPYHQLGLNINESFITTWAHRLNDKDKRVFMKLLSSEDLCVFHKEELITSILKERIEKLHPSINSYTTKHKFDIIFDYISKEFPYCKYALRSDGKGTKEGYKWTHTALGTFEHKTGVCEGRSELIRLVSNSRAFEIPCYEASGKIFGDVGHSWNQIIINGRILNYDSSFCRKALTNEELKAKGYVIESEKPPVMRIDKTLHL